MHILINLHDMACNIVIYLRRSAVHQSQTSLEEYLGIDSLACSLPNNRLGLRMYWQMRTTTQQALHSAVWALRLWSEECCLGWMQSTPRDGVDKTVRCGLLSVPSGGYGYPGRASACASNKTSSHMQQDMCHAIYELVNYS